MPAPEITTGTTIAFSTSFIAQLMSLNPRQGMSRKAIKSSHFGTTVAHTYVPGDLHEPGTLSGTMKFDPGTKPPIT